MRKIKVSEDLLHKIEGYKPTYESYPSDKEGVEWCFGTRDHHSHEDVIEIPEWMVALRDEGVSVYVTGAFENECILDLQTALSELDIEYERVEGIIAGTHVDYEYFEEPQNELKSDLEFAFFDVQEFLYDGWSESSYDDLNKYIENLRLNDLNDIHEKINFITSEINSLRQDLDVDVSSEVFEYIEPLLTADEPDWYYDLKVKEAKKEVLSFSDKLIEIVKKDDTTKKPSKLSEISHLSIKSKSRTF